MNFIEIGADEDEEFTTGQTGDSIKQQMHHISEAVSRLVVLDDTTDFQMISALYVAPSTSIIQHLELGSSKLYVFGMIRIIAALPTLISLACEVDEPVLDTMTSSESTNLSSLHAKHYPLSSNFRALYVPYKTDISGNVIANVAMIIAVLCPNLVHVHIGPELRREFSREVAWSTYNRPFKPYANTFRHLMYKD
ncbi:hypothetical protein GGI19_004491 [Coemansia pectinata]|uniref:Uncharacterized protein n=1 Tax=Coemansia pectinata TaxID=1052879 RepID=A0A9W8GW54_9FUNG|nr:hypothetical protein GGI19_004491 [Coemansia pectinata]